MKRTVSEATLTTATFEGFVRHRTSDGVIRMVEGLDENDAGWWINANAHEGRLPLFVNQIVEGSYSQTCLTIWSDANLTVGLYIPPGDSATRTLVLPNGISPTTPVGGVQIYAAGGEGKIMDAAGNVTTFSPHHFEQIELDPDDAYPTVVHHQNAYLGIEETIYLSKLARLVENLTGEKLIWSRNLSASETRDFAADEQSQANRRQQAIIAHQELLAKIQLLPEEKREEKLKTLPPAPEPYTQKPIPQWIKDRLNKRQK